MHSLAYACLPAHPDHHRPPTSTTTSPLQDLLLPEEGQGFVTLRCPLRDVEEEDLLPCLPGRAVGWGGW